MRIDRFAVAGCALVAASMVLMSCGSSDNTTPANSVGIGSTPVVASSSIATDTTLSTGSSLSTGTTSP